MERRRAILLQSLVYLHRRCFPQQILRPSTPRVGDQPHGYESTQCILAIPGQNPRRPRSQLAVLRRVSNIPASLRPLALRFIRISFELLNSLISLSDHLESLEEMCIFLSDNHIRDPLSDPDGTNLSVMLCSALRLRRFTQWGGSPLLPIFEHLTEYSLQYDVACGLHVLASLRHILMVSHWLEELTIRRNAFLPNESLPQGNVHPVVTHTALRRLDTDDPVIIMASNLPRLEELTIKFNNIASSRQLAVLILLSHPSAYLRSTYSNFTRTNLSQPSIPVPMSVPSN
ncbi:hypothetical protein ARMSODRAFT_609472 [Armillaria solidipes]|uniref:Uncharacterized protein n=1 Tax=Armillaria solidipes TaxID=1076256 RepID=A0A2H3B5F0_9AGAR|nr:hypothetical protein ARMSODRAFT_609472 [Armillaria solidipes]